jgi:hypothetical protein
LSHRLKLLGQIVFKIGSIHTLHLRIVVANVWATIWITSLCQME